MTRQVRGGDLKPGDFIEVWWSPRRDMITHFEAYKGPLAYLWPKGARIAYFGICKTGMTIGNDDMETLVAGPA